MLDADFSILLYQVDKGLLVGLPSLHYVMLFASIEASTQENPISEFRSEALRGSDELKLAQDEVDFTRIFKYECMQLWDCAFYEKS